ncbi:DUF6958 family protein [Planktotalea sp.]|uniref:DUF6958 family protein n=1 Tax=Planktotalea sp. TaxID=2029877 RepID=UPI003D6C6BF5
MPIEKTAVQNPNTPGRSENLRSDKYDDMRAALMQVLPKEAPGLTFDALKTAAKPHLSPTLFPNGKTSGWWAKSVQLDLEAKGLVTRLPTKPLTFHKS